MGRNKLIYAMADFGLVVSAEYRKGGTWEGAVEELKRSPGRRIFVRLSGAVPAGNQKLADLGALAFPGTEGYGRPAERLKEAAEASPAPQPKEQLSLFEKNPGPTAATGRVTTDHTDHTD
jgi:predicted Rossmann fold nucleotide-binding protein DprA/Smf involved in DNA uptake